MLQNPFLIIRYTCFSIILLLNVVTLFFAAWNVAIAKSSGQAAPGASVLLLFNSCALFFAIAISLLELVMARAKTSKVKFECAWTALLAALQLAAALIITATGPPRMCASGGSAAACTSATVLVPLAWLSTFSTIVYFLTLTITTIVYAPYHAGIWSSSVYAVPWFALGDPPPLYHKSSTSAIRSTERSNGIWDEEQQRKDEEGGCASSSRNSCLSLVTAPWAKAYQNRRGLDRPFATRSQVVAANPEIPAPPPKSYPLPIASRYLDLPVLPTDVDGQRPLSRSATLSQWVRADMASGRTVHTRPPISPR